ASKAETEIEELRQLILAMDLKAEKRMDRLEKIIEVGFTQVNGEIKRIDERIGHVEKRIEDTRFSLEKRLDDTNKRIDDTRSSLGKQIDGTKSSLEKQIEATNARLNSITIGFFGIVGILVTGILTVLGKLVFFSNPLS
ncbi:MULTISPECIES: hypothetical protein, partial [Spirulina sp. CCY15215]|uniref:hypothetical protein n=1 Tax=Spirulina sp. CCY15215 TaxID=2767591 RepID=UPI0019504497